MLPGLLCPGVYTFRLTVTDNTGATASDEVSVTVNAAPGSTTRIEAENWTAMSGVVREATTDVGGGQSVGYIDPGDWMEYSYSAPSTGSYTVSLRLAAPAAGGQLQIKNSAGTVLATVNVPNTGGWQSWQTVTTTINLSAGTQTLRIVSTSPSTGWNINWWELSQGGTPPANQPPTANAGTDKTITLPTNSVTLNGSGTDPDGSIVSYTWSKVSGGAATITSPASASTTITGLVQGSYTFRLTVVDNSGASASDDVVVVVNAALPAISLRIEAEAFTMASSVIKQATQDLGGGQQVSALDDGDWMQYWVEVPYTGTYTVSFRVACTKGGSKFQLLNAAGLVLGTANLPNTGSLQNWQTVSIQATLTGGAQNFKIFVSKSSGTPVFNWWQLSGTSAGSSTPTSANPATAIELQNSSASISDSSFLAYPNPFQDHFTMQVQNSYIGQVKVQLFNLNGVLQKQFVFNKTNISVQLVLSVNDLPRGEYMLMILTDKWEKKGKVIKL